MRMEHMFQGFFLDEGGIDSQLKLTWSPEATSFSGDPGWFARLFWGGECGKYQENKMLTTVLLCVCVVMRPWC